jgi:hypothetical protein
MQENIPIDCETVPEVFKQTTELGTGQLYVEIAEIISMMEKEYRMGTEKLLEE